MDTHAASFGPIDEIRVKSGLLLAGGRFGARRLALALQGVLEPDAHALPLLHALALEWGGQPDVAQANIPNRSIAHFFRLSEWRGETLGKMFRERKCFPPNER
jgi:hypothetical protein